MLTVALLVTLRYFGTAFTYLGLQFGLVLSFGIRKESMGRRNAGRRGGLQ